MNPTNDLFNLIKSLTPPEKKVFKMKFSSGEEREKTYMALYDAIVRQTTAGRYDEAKIKKQLARPNVPVRYGRGGAIDARSFPVIKNYLFHRILDTLCSYYPGTLPDFTVQRIIEKAKILNNKQHTGAAYKLIRNAKQAAIKNELFPEALLALQTERKIIEQQDMDGYEKAMADNLAEEKSVIELHTNLTAYVHLNSKLLNLSAANVTIRSKRTVAFFKEILQHPLLQDESSALSFQAKYYFYSMQGICYRRLGEFEKALQYREKLLAMFEPIPKHTAAVPMESFKIIMYINALHGIAVTQNSLRKFTDAMQNVLKIRDIRKLSPQFAKIIPPELPFRTSVITETDLYLRIPDYEKGVAQIPRIESDLKKFGLTTPKLYMLYLNISLLYFGINDYHKALLWLNKILNENKNEYALDLICASKILFLIVHIEMGNEDMLEYAARNTEHYLTIRKRKYKLESIFLDLLKIILNPDRKKDLPKIYPKMLSQFKKLNADPYEKGAFELFDYVSWLESKISGKSFAEVLREKALHKQ